MFAEMYGQRAHFLHELLQNAEDALRTRQFPSSRSDIRFDLRGSTLISRHYGRPFTDDDVRSICALGESTKDETDIGRFGIGFKSVFAFSDAPEVHSGQDDFRIQEFVFPFKAAPVDRHDDETVFLFPLRDASAAPDIERGMQELGPRVLLFLRHIDAIEWTVSNGASGTYLRETQNLDCSGPTQVRHVTILGESSSERGIDETWLVFSRPVHLDDGDTRFVEIAFHLEHDRLVRVPRSPLVVFFPTVVETHLGFIVQGPYRTTMSRDSVLSPDRWNDKCVNATGHLLTDALQWLRCDGKLDVGALHSLPIDRTKFENANMFTPLYESTMSALQTKPLLPTSDGAHVPASVAAIAQTDALRTLLDADQVAHLLGSGASMSWMAPEISQRRTPELRRYLMDILRVPEVTPDDFLRRIDHHFLKKQRHEWLSDFHEFLAGIPWLHQRARTLPIIRLATGDQVVPFIAGKPQAYLPGDEKTGFPTVHPETCRSPEAWKFLLGIGLSVPDPVDDVVRHVLSKYSDEVNDIDDSRYSEDIDRILSASRTDSAEQQRKLRTALQQSFFVAACDAKTGEPCYCRPGSLYFRTTALGRLFDGVDGVEFVDETCERLASDEVRRLLRDCGVACGLRVVSTHIGYDREELRQTRQREGLERDSWGRAPSGRSVLGLDELLDYLPSLDRQERRVRSQTLWEMLSDMAARSPDSFSVEYSWGYSHETRSVRLDATFVRKLNDAGWVPNDQGELQLPSSISFPSLGWREDPFLVSKIRFRPEAVEQLAREADIDLGVLNLLRAQGINSVGVLRERLGLPQREEVTERDANTAGAVASESDTGREGMSSGGESGKSPSDAGNAGEVGLRGQADESSSAGAEVGSQSRGTTSAKDRQQRPRSGATSGRSHFHSYVSVSTGDDEENDTDGSRREGRRDLEEKAIALILAREPAWRRTATGNPGFDLFRTRDGSANDTRTAWCEVKAMSGTLDRNPVGLSRTQFDFARQHGAAFWLYIVERAGQDDARILRIQDPAGKAQTFTFDRGWRQVAEAEPSE